MIESVGFYPRYLAESTLFNNSYAVISITDPDQAPAKINGTDNLLRISFLDIEEHIEHPNFKEDFLFDEAKAFKIIDFISAIKELKEYRKVIVHCEAGVSRSAAVALFIHYFTDCEFEDKHLTNFANKLIIHTFEQTCHLNIPIPKKKESNSGIILIKNIL